MNIDATAVTQALDSMQSQCAQLRETYPDIVLIAIERGGVAVAEHIAKGSQIPIEGKININFYRDDFSQNGLHPVVKASSLPGSVEGRSIILVDDVLHTGRTLRAALNEIFDFGRPSRVILAVLASRNSGRELPFQADIVGINLAASAEQQVTFDPQTHRISIVNKAS